MSKYNTFLTLFIISVAGALLFFLFYIQSVMNLVRLDETVPAGRTDFFEIWVTVFTPQVIITFLLTVMGSLACRIYGIVLVAKNKAVTDGEKALWVVGFILMGFITAIVFLVLAKGKRFTA